MKLVIFNIVFSIIIFSNCRKLVQDEFPDIQRTPVINSLLIADSIVKLHVSLTGKIDTTHLEYVDNAVINLFINNGFKESLSYLDNGIYQSKTIVKPGNIYSCEIKIPGYNDIFCEDSIPFPTRLEELNHFNTSGKDEEGLSYAAIKFTFNNKINDRKYYEVKIKFKNYGYQDEAELVNIIDPLIINEGLPIALFSNEMIKNESYEMTLNYTTNSFSYMNMNLYPLIVEIRSVSYDYYQFVKSMYLYEIGRFPDGLSSSSSSYPIYSNVEGGKGIFAGYSSFKSDTIYPNK
jgi:hypothetical protein